ncbi:hypothetical protein QM013_28285 [Pseudomonas aeruginosa]|uniref:hypothetical protein n=1 Tax=Pseudomonas aeruginosa TaxID=287 RepID=UPI0028748661|nr:hypothetical protein [Pseudomonas aeruginosa]MDS1044028.1 hypothetical protein [Pseudomonas aeruginosa]
MRRLTHHTDDPAEQVHLDLSEDQRAAIKATVKKAQQSLAILPFLLEQSTVPGLTRAQARMAMETTEFELATLGRSLGVDTEAGSTIEQRFGELRQANMRIRDLEALLGQQMPAEAIQPALGNLARKLRDWWRLEGFGHTSEIQFGEYSLQVRFSLQSLSARPLIAGAEHLSHAERKALWLADLERRGFVLHDGKGVTDCPASRDALRALFAQRLPGTHKIAQFVSREGDHASKLVSVEVYVYDLAQILTLPVPPPKAQDVDA